MRLRRLLQDSGIRIVATVITYVAFALGALAVVVVAALAPEQRSELFHSLRGQVSTLVLGGVIALAGLTYLLLRGPGAYPAAARRHTADVRLLLEANPDHRLAPSGPPELDELAAGVNALADRRAAAEAGVADAVAAARGELEQERDRLAALMADLDVAVLVCSPGGRIQLYNSAARALLADDPALGLGRSVFAFVERELVTHALDRLADGAAAARAATALPDGRLLQVRVTQVAGSGFGLILEEPSRVQGEPRIVLTDIPADDLLAVLRRELEKHAGVQPQVVLPGDSVWVRVDSYALARAVGHLAVRLRQHCAASRPSLTVSGGGALEIVWQGRVPDQQELEAWLAEPLPLGAASSAAEVLDQHDAVPTTRSDGGRSHLRVPLPPAEAGRPGAIRATVGSRPEFYAFDLFDHPEQAPAWQDRRLEELAYTVLDTETTGFLPEDGDEVVALGAVHVVGGRVRPHEVFERLVDPRRPVPAAATKVHGITDEMLRGQPLLDEVLPQFARFAEDRVLVGHNVAFDLSFLRSREERTGVRLDQPVLDTLLLDAALHPDHETHDLEAVAARLGVDVIGRHTALGDALVTAEVFVRLLSLLRAQGISTLGEALAASRTTYQNRLDAAAGG